MNQIMPGSLRNDDLGRTWVTLKRAKNDFSGYFTENAPRMTRSCLGPSETCEK
ncbi:hypothetical protein T11_18387 [Trichinella zimbabwensis]|uniref:Uncharacterized protein n=1 Tax=Trichinella zimbabwensis TaxID=268475 RepID=A0A0V1F1U3_9BILA|nr:hypothetical protein T11_18387 [Trichinella zimbabwensis]